jgi:ornithine--oxo-acid transaminase
LCSLIFKKGIITKATHKHCVRFTPPLVINKEEIDHVLGIVEESLYDLEAINASK